MHGTPYHTESQRHPAWLQDGATVAGFEGDNLQATDQQLFKAFARPVNQKHLDGDTYDIDSQFWTAVGEEEINVSVAVQVSQKVWNEPDFIAMADLVQYGVATREQYNAF